jgi:hypothetical protein
LLFSASLLLLEPLLEPLPPVVLAAPPVAVDAPPVAVAVAVPVAEPAFAFCELLFEPVPPAPPVTVRQTWLNAALFWVRVFDWELVLLPELVADAAFDCVVSPWVADGALLVVVVGLVVVVAIALLPPSSASAAAVPMPSESAAIALAT